MFALFLVAATTFRAVEATVCSASSQHTVEALVFSGTSNPTVQLTSAQTTALCEVLDTSRPAAQTCRVLGFTGWRVCSSQTCEVLLGQPAVDDVLLDAFSNQLSRDVESHIQEVSSKLNSSHDECRSLQSFDNIVPASSDCTAPVVGPDDPKKVMYDPQTDDRGCFVKKQGENNCYDYANDIVTNSFAQPGRGSGKCAHGARPCVPNTCEDVKNAAVSDGLRWIGTDLPKKLPTQGHYVSLHIWPKSNFHWLRMDKDGKWSHKPGGSEVRNVDNNGKIITDPGRADVSPWSEHCGYLQTVPSKVVGTIQAAYSEEELLLV
mmetsp:Transcript_62386/g.115806  ORF Transcript_62386/g.115806 Transcript_62386/m.115806 type:complete len:320 (-) Transcript_62386:80-1039(-)